MAQYVAGSPHTSEDQKRKDSNKFAFERKSGEYTGWAYIDAYIDVSSEKSRAR